MAAADEDAATKRASNREAARVSRMRKKGRLDELQRSVVFLTRENAELREQNELLRGALAGDRSVMDLMETLRQDNEALKIALYEMAHHIAALGLDAAMPHTSAALKLAGLKPKDGAPEGGDDEADDVV